MNIFAVHARLKLQETFMTPRSFNLASIIKSKKNAFYTFLCFNIHSSVNMFSDDFLDILSKPFNILDFHLSADSDFVSAASSTF